MAASGPKAGKRTQRRLAAILCADVAGYSRMMGADEEATIATLTACRKVFLTTIEHHHGRVVDAKGDAILAEFASVVDAVTAAVAIQGALAEQNAGLPEERRMQFRMGINLGDVVVQDDAIYGDGVNVAARLEALAEPGGICVSRSTYDQVEPKLDLEWEYLGEQAVKNIDRPVAAYRVRAAPAAPGRSADPSGGATGDRAASLELPERPSIAVLPFDNLSADASQGFFADGLVEDILTSLSRISSMTVIARNSSFAYKGKAVDVRQVAQELGVRYVVEGSVRQGGRRLRVAVQLIDSTSGAHVWAESYDRVMEDVFDIQDEITKEIVTALQVSLSDSEHAQFFSRGTRNVQAWGLCIRAIEHFHKLNPLDHAKAVELAEQAIQLDPDYGLAWALLGSAYWYDSRAAFAKDTEQTFARAVEIETKARALDEGNPWALALGAQIHLSQRHYDEAIAIGAHAVSLFPSSAHLRFWYGFMLLCGAQADKAISMFRDAIRLNPHGPPYYTSLYARALDAAGRPVEGLEVVEAGLRRNPYQFGLVFQRAAILAREGLTDYAKEAVVDLRRIHPNFRVSHVDGFLLFKDQEYVNRLCEALRGAGLPD